MPPLTIGPPIGFGGHIEELRKARIRGEAGAEGLLVLVVVVFLLPLFSLVVIVSDVLGIALCQMFLFVKTCQKIKSHNATQKW